jgi:hypothetical protein
MRARFGRPDLVWIRGLRGYDRQVRIDVNTGLHRVPEGAAMSTSGDTPDQTPDTTAAKDPDDWVTGDEAMTGPQRSYLETLAREAGEDVPGDMTKAQASEMIDRLQGKTGRGGGG